MEGAAHTPQLTVSMLTGRIAELVNRSPALQGLWVAGELSDVNVNRSSGHCYFQLVERHPDTGQTVATVKGTIWNARFRVLSQLFRQATGMAFETGMKVLLKVSVNYHQAYGLSVQVTDIAPEYTAGDVLRRRAENRRRLEQEGIIDLNRQQPWPATPLRVAVVTSPTAAGYGDFLRQFYDPQNNPNRLAFHTRLYPAVMQGRQAPLSIIEALNRVYADLDTLRWDYVAIVRGGGASDDLACFDDYDLAANVAQFPVPVVIGLGHERDVLLLDYVAKHRESTPTACAQFFIRHGNSLVDHLRQRSAEMQAAVLACTSSHKARLAQLTGRLPALAHLAITRARADLDSRQALLRQGADTAISRQTDRLDATEKLLRILDPQATLDRGYSITRVNGRAVTDTRALAPGDTVTTTLAHGSFTSTVTPQKP